MSSIKCQNNLFIQTYLIFILFKCQIISVQSGLSGLHTTAGGVASVGARVTFSSPDENARADETAPSYRCQPTLATPLVVCCHFP